MGLLDMFAGLSQSLDRTLLDVFVKDDHISEAAEILRNDPHAPEDDEDFERAVGDLAEELRGQ